MRHSQWALLLFCTASLIAVSKNTFAQNYSFHPEPLQPRIEAGGKVGTERNIGLMEGWMPLVQDDDSVLYGDIRWMADNESNQEGNLGIGYRIMRGDHILGAHGWIDRRRTDRGSNFHQVTGGVEFMKEDWDVKANAYVPLNTEKSYTTANAGSASPYLVGTGLFIDTLGQVIEEAQPGGDVEVGYRLPVFEKHLDAVRVYGGGYAFIGDKTDDVVGGRLRASIDVNPLLNVGARFQHDEPRGAQAFIEATLRFPFTAKKRFQQHGLRARLDESPERDIDIVTNAAIDNGLKKQVINTTSGQIQRVIHVDNTATPGGDGSIENPFSTLASAQVAMLDNDTIYIHQGNGTSSGQNQGIVIDKNNIQLIGSGSDFIYDTDRFTVRRPGPNGADGSLILAATAAPVITNINAPASATDFYVGNGVLITGDDALVTGITVNGAAFAGIRVRADGISLNSATVQNVTTIGNGTTGIVAHVLNNGYIGSIDFSDNISTNNSNMSGVAGSGIGFATQTGGTIGTGILSGNTVSGNIAHGLTVSSSVGTINHVVIKNNASTGNNVAGMSVGSTATGQIINVEIADNISSGNTSQGLSVSSTGTGSHLTDVTVSSNTMNGNGQQGIWLNIQGGASLDNALFENNVSNNNTGVNGRGIQIEANGLASIINSVSAISNTTNGNESYGIYVAAASGTIASNILDSNIINNNQRDGIRLVAFTDGNLTSSISRNTATSNGDVATYYAIRIDNDTINTFNVDLGGGSLGSIGGNRFYNNDYRDVYIDSRPGTAGATPGVAISAQHNWWGVNTGLNQGTRATFDNGAASPGSSIDATNHLTTDPGP